MTMYKYDLKQNNRNFNILRNMGDLGEDHATLIRWSREIFGYKGYAEEGVHWAWHDQPSTILEQLNGWKQGDYVFAHAERCKMDLDAYCILSAVFGMPYHFKDVRSLYGGKKVRGWLASFRDYCGSREAFSEVADLVLHLLKYQVGGPQPIVFTKQNIFKDLDEIIGVESCKDKYAEAYITLLDRVKLFKVQGVDPKLWLEAKYKNVMEVYDKPHPLTTIVNENGFDPDLRKLKVQTEDKWRVIRGFLGLSPECEFSDGYIPKGWRPASNNVEDLKLVTKIKGNGFYSYPDGSHRKGKRHYAQNAYFVIKCDPSNFEEFKKDWDNVRMISNKPTWEEYSKYGVKSEVEYDEAGNNINGRGESITWRNK